MRVAGRRPGDPAGVDPDRPPTCSPSSTSACSGSGIARLAAAGRHRPFPALRAGGADRCFAGGLARDRDFPRPARFANALIETSLPGVIIVALSHHMDPQLVFGFWPPLLYFVFILLSTLRLDFWLSLWTGTVAAVQQIVLVLLAAADRAVGRHARRDADLSFQPQRRAAGGGRGRRRRGRQPAPAVREVGRGGGGARPRHQPVRPARLARRGRPPARDVVGTAERDAHRLRAVPRHPRLHGDDAHSGRPARRWRCSTTSSPR